MKNHNIIQSFKRAFEGLIYLYITHKHFKIQIIFGILTIFAGIFLKLDIIEWLILIFAILFVFFAEFTNTIIEEINNLISKEFHPKIKIIKDMGSTLVLISIIFSLIVFFSLFVKKFY